MTDPKIVQDFLDISGQWNSSLLFVMAASVLTTFIGYRYAMKREKPIFSNQFYLPEGKKIDKQLILGALLFGIGWGLVGLCPGPVIASISSLQPKILVFLLFMILGMFFANVCKNK